MAEPQPSNIEKGASQPDVLPANAEDRKAAAAMSALDINDADDAAPKKELDMKALSAAMKNLEVGSSGKEGSAAVAKKKEEEVKKAPLVKVDAGDVALMADQLDMNKIKATELLRAHEADVVRAMTAWVAAAV